MIFFLNVTKSSGVIRAPSVVLLHTIKQQQASLCQATKNFNHQVWCEASNIFIVGISSPVVFRVFV